MRKSTHKERNFQRLPFCGWFWSFWLEAEHGAGQSHSQQAEWAKEKRKLGPTQSPQGTFPVLYHLLPVSHLLVLRSHNTTLRIQPLTFRPLVDTEHLNCGSIHCCMCWRVQVHPSRNTPHYQPLLLRQRPLWSTVFLPSVFLLGPTSRRRSEGRKRTELGCLLHLFSSLGGLSALAEPLLKAPAAARWPFIHNCSFRITVKAPFLYHLMVGRWRACCCCHCPWALPLILALLKPYSGLCKSLLV